MQIWAKKLYAGTGAVDRRDPIEELGRTNTQRVTTSIQTEEGGVDAAVPRCAMTRTRTLGPCNNVSDRPSELSVRFYVFVGNSAPNTIDARGLWAIHEFRESSRHLAFGP